MVDTFASIRPESNCLEQIRRLYATLDSMARNLPENKTLYISYTVSTTALDFNKQPVTSQSHVEVYVNKSRLYSLTNEAEVYRDEESSVLISPKRQTIIITDAHKKRKQALMQYTSMVQDTLFSLAQEEDCGYVKTETGDKVKRIELKMTEKGVKLFNIRYMDILLDKEEKAVHRMTIEYDEGYRLRQMELAFHAFDFDYKTDMLKRPALSAVFKSDNLVHAKYKGYKVIDRRKRSKQE